jgi:hypothetical protein
VGEFAQFGVPPRQGKIGCTTTAAKNIRDGVLMVGRHNVARAQGFSGPFAAHKTGFLFFCFCQCFLPIYGTARHTAGACLG